MACWIVTQQFSSCATDNAASDQCVAIHFFFLPCGWQGQTNGGRGIVQRNLVLGVQNTDKYAFGVLLWEMAEGVRAWAGLTHAQVFPFG